MKTQMYNFDIPQELIAQNPTDKRSDSRMLVYYRDTHKIIDSYTRDLTNFIDENYFIVFNNSRVIPARITITKCDSNIPGEILILKIIDNKTVEAMTDKAKKYKKGTVILLPDGTKAFIKEDIDNVTKLIVTETDTFTFEYFEKYGSIPLPPYMRKKPTAADKERYQTVYSKQYGSAAAPTAGLHFDDKIFQSLNENNIDYSFVALHVGLGTFMPIYADDIESHIIHKEEYSITKNDVAKIANAIASHKKILPIGTTSLRTIETVGNFVPTDHDIYGTSDIYIYPPYQFKVADCLFTNFHTPKSSLAVLVSAMIGLDELLRVYQYAVDNKYRFFSYGDAMLIL